MEASWGGFCGLRGKLERLGGIWKPLVDVFGGLGGVLKVILAVFKASGGLLEASWRLLGWRLKPLGDSWRDLGGVLEVSRRCLGGVQPLQHHFQLT